MARKHFGTNYQLSKDLSSGTVITSNTRSVVATNIQYYREKEGLSQQALADKLGITNKAISNWEHGVSRPDIEHIPALCIALGTVPTRLFGMSGDISSKEAAFIEKLHRLGEHERNAILSLANTLFEAQEMRNQPRPHIHLLPIAVKAAAAGIGDPSEYYTDPDEQGLYVYDGDISDRADCVFCVNGQSMEPSYYDGDRVYVKQTTTLRPGQIGIFSIHNEIYIKEYQPDGLHSHNPRYKPILFNSYDRVVPIGLVIGKVDKEDIPSGEEIDLYRELENEQ